MTVCVPTTMRYGLVLTVANWEANLTTLSLACKIHNEYNLIEVLSALSLLRELYLRDRGEHYNWDRRELYHWNRFDQGMLEVTGLSHTFFESLHPDEKPLYLPNLEVFSYEGNLAVLFLEPLIIRSRIRAGNGPLTNLEKMAVLRKVKIQADQVSSEFTIAEYPDSQYVWEVMRMIELGVLELITIDGDIWQ